MASALSSHSFKALSRSLQARKAYQPRQVDSRVSCNAGKREEGSLKRRDALLAGGLLAGGSLAIRPQPSQATTVTLRKDKLSSPQIKELRGAMTTRSEKTLSEILTGADSRDALRLLINDAGTYDTFNKTGGVDGSIIFDEELNRPENAALKPYVEKLKKAKAIIDKTSAEFGQEGIGYADLIVLGVKVTTQLAWFDIKTNTTGGDAEAAAVLSKAFGTAFPITIGREDATGPAPPGLIPAADAPAADVIEFWRKLGNKTPDEEPSYFKPKPPFYGKVAFLLYTASCKDPEAAENAWAEAYPDQYGPMKQSYDKSRRSVTRTVYEVDFVEFFTRLANLGASFGKVKYLKDLVFEVKA